MSEKSFENYTSIAKIASVSNLEVAGRYSFQALAEKNILRDIVNKLDLSSNDHLLEIGCGPGNLLLPLSYWVECATGIDNEIAIERLKAKSIGSTNIQLYVGNFLDMTLPRQSFSKILVYSVIQYMDSYDNACLFLKRAFQLLRPGGILLLGDLPNIDKKQRWLKTPEGAISSNKWKAQIKEVENHPMSELPADLNLVNVDDLFVMKLLNFARSVGLESYLLSQRNDLPFGNTREDILFVAPK